MILNIFIICVASGDLKAHNSSLDSEMLQAHDTRTIMLDRLTATQVVFKN